MDRRFGFIGDDVDLSSRNTVYPASSASLFLFPLSAFSAAMSGKRCDPDDRAVVEASDGTSLSGRFAFARYSSSGYVNLGKDLTFDFDFDKAGAAYKCTVWDESNDVMSDMWLFFDSRYDEELVAVDHHVQKMWIVENGEEASFHEVPVRVSETGRILAFEGRETAYRYFFAFEPDGDGPGLSCCLSSEEIVVSESGSADGRDLDSKLVNLGVLQDATRGVAKIGGTPAKEGFIPQLGPDGKIDESMLPGSYGSIDKELRKHIADKSNPHWVTKEQVGLGNADNTSDMDKPVSTATERAIRTAFDALRNEINEKFEKLEYIDDPIPNTAYGLLGRQNKLVSNMNSMVGLISNT